MRKEDACKQPREALHERRKQAIGMHRKGVGVMEVAEMTGLSGTAVNTALCLHGAGASATSKPGLRCKKPMRSVLRASERDAVSSAPLLKPKPSQKVLKFTWTMRPRCQQRL